MAMRTRMTEMEAYAVKTRQSEPVGSRGKGTLLLQRKASARSRPITESAT